MKNSGNQNIREIRERFSRISIKKGFISILFFVILTVIVFFIALSDLNLNSTWQELIISYVIYIIPFLLVIWVLRRANHPISSIFTGGSVRVSQVSLVVPLITISIGLVWMVILGLNLISAEAAENYLTQLNNTALFDLGPEATLLQYVLLFGVIAVVGPVVEEIIFRGIMIERLGAKYNYGWAVVISSVIFGVLHPSPVGAFIVGVVLSLLYLKTRSLKIPILIHIANNTIATFFIMGDEKFSFSSNSWETVEPYISNAWVGILFFTAGIVWVGWYIIQNCHIIVEQQPFKLEGEKT